MKTHEHNHDSDPLTHLLRETIAGEPLPPADPGLREALLKRLDQPAVQPALSAAAASRRRTFFQRAGIALVSTAALALVAVLWQRPDLQVIGWNQQVAVQQEMESRANKNVPAGAQPSDELLLVEATAVHDRRVRSGESVRVNEYFDKQPATANNPVGDVGGGGIAAGSTSAPSPNLPRSRPWAEQSEPGQSGFDPLLLGPAKGPAVGEGKPASGRVSGVDTASGKKFGDGYVPDASKPADPARPQNSGPEAQPAPAVTAATPRIIVQGETVERLSIEFETKSGSGEGQGLPAGLTPGQRPIVASAQPANNFYNESGAKQAGGKELKQIEDRVTVDKSETLSREAIVDEKVRVVPVAEAIRTKLAEQIAANDGVPAKAPEADGEVREKFNKVVALTDELNRARRLSELQPRVEREKLDQLATAIDEVRKLEAKYRFIPQPGGEQYARIAENQFQSPNSEAHALSTFSIDVDTASYANVRRFLNNGQLPPPDAVRLEELVNYFKYKYPQPKGDDPFSANMEMADCPWHPGHKLLRVGLQGKEIHRAERPASNLVFLIDTSGSMTDENKLPLLKQAFTMLVGELGENDKVTIVTYAGNAGLRLPPTRGHQKETILAAIDGMQSGGSTHGSAGIALAYEVAAAQFIKGGTNKVILATDGDLNVGITDNSALVELITKKAETGVYLTVLGVGTGNLKDAKMEQLADNGNGIYAYLDSVREARKVLVEEMSGSLVTIAKDVKIQIEFNPAQVQSYRLLGYENRVMANQDFRNDAKDAGEIGAGHSVTALYEVVLVGAADAKGAGATATEGKPLVEPLKYQRVPAAEKPALQLKEEAQSGELLTLRLRYKKPEATKEDPAKELEFPLKNKGGNFSSASPDFQFASAVVAFGLTLRNSEFRGGANLSAVAEIATAVTGEDVGGHRAEFLDLVRRAKTLRGE